MKSLIFIIYIGSIMSVPTFASSYKEDALLTQETRSADTAYFEEIRARLQASTDLTLPKAETLAMFDELLNFVLGRFLLKHKVLNGHWTAYVILHGLKNEIENPLEKWCLERAPVLVATRERFHIFQRELQKRIQPGMTIASIPCGLMDDLITLDYKDLPGVKLVGIDLDQESLDSAKENAGLHSLDNVQFHKENAWKLQHESEFDIITSNGLNIYEPRDEMVIDLYCNFNKALQPNGILITSFLTPPPALSPESTWRGLDFADLKKQKALLFDIIQAGGQSFRTEARKRVQLEAAGFKVLEVIYDGHRLFPTIIAEKIREL